MLIIELINKEFNNTCIGTEIIDRGDYVGIVPFVQEVSYASLIIKNKNNKEAMDRIIEIYNEIKSLHETTYLEYVENNKPMTYDSIVETIRNKFKKYAEELDLRLKEREEDE